MRHTMIPVMLAILLPATAYCDDGLIAHWPLAKDGQDVSGNGMHTTPHAVDFTAIGPSGTPHTAAAFDGQSAMLELPAHQRLQLGTKDFSVSVWVDADSGFDDVPGDLISHYENTQSYAFAILEGRLYVGTWPSGRVYRFEKPHQWTDVGRLGEELEVMGMLVHNGRLVAGTLPLAEVYEFDNKSSWNKLTRLDHTPDVRYRRACR